MQIVIEIPDKEFGIDINDKFQDFFNRLKAETEHHLKDNTNLVCGNYELETIDMFLEAFKNVTPLPKGHGELKDMDDIYEALEGWDDDTGWIVDAIDCQAQTIIETDKGGMND